LMHPSYYDGEAVMAEKVEEATDGRVEFVIYNGGSMIGYNEAWDAVTAGQTQISQVWAHTHPGRFPITQMGWLPFLGGASAAIFGVAMNDFMTNDPLAAPMAAEYSRAVRCTTHTSAIQNLHTKNAMIRTLADFEGKIIGAENRIGILSLENWGATPMLIQMSESVLALEKGVIEGGIWPWAPLRSFGTAEYLHYHTIMDLCFSVCNPCMNKEFYESLPDNVVDAFETWMWGETWALMTGLTLDNGSEVDVNWFVDKGDEFYTLPPDERALWLDGAYANYEEWYQLAKDNGVADPEAMVAKFREYNDKYTANPVPTPDWFGYAGKYGSPLRPGGWE
jgi:TRAP-type C4-dicarboxylate transport system substrate-binding protein